MATLKCSHCTWHNFDFFHVAYEEGNFCGLHGRKDLSEYTSMSQINFNHRGSCGYYPKLVEDDPRKYVQLSLF